MAVAEIMAKILPEYPADSAPESPCFRNSNGPTYVAGGVHGGIDFNFQNPAYNTDNTASVRSPVAGKVVYIREAWGRVIIKSDVDGTFHSILQTTRFCSVASEVPGHRPGISFLRAAEEEKSEF